VASNLSTERRPDIDNRARKQRRASASPLGAPPLQAPVSGCAPDFESPVPTEMVRIVVENGIRIEAPRYVPAGKPCRVAVTPENLATAARLADSAGDVADFAEAIHGENDGELETEEGEDSARGVHRDRPLSGEARHYIQQTESPDIQVDASDLLAAVDRVTAGDSELLRFLKAQLKCAKRRDIPDETGWSPQKVDAVRKRWERFAKEHSTELRLQVSRSVSSYLTTTPTGIAKDRETNPTRLYEGSATWRHDWWSWAPRSNTFTPVAAWRGVNVPIRLWSGLDQTVLRTSFFVFEEPVADGSIIYPETPLPPYTALAHAEAIAGRYVLGMSWERAYRMRAAPVFEFRGYQHEPPKVVPWVEYWESPERTGSGEHCRFTEQRAGQSRGDSSVALNAGDVVSKVRDYSFGLTPNHLHAMGYHAPSEQKPGAALNGSAFDWSIGADDFDGAKLPVLSDLLQALSIATCGRCDKAAREARIKLNRALMGRRRSKWEIPSNLEIVENTRTIFTCPKSRV